MQKQTFAQELKDLVRKSGIRQNDVAAKLGVSAAAISQFLHGQTLPSPEHFDQMLSMLSHSAAENRRLRELWVLCRAVPPADGKSELNHNLFLLRAARGFSPAQAAREAGITEKRLIKLEKDPAAKATGKELKAFRRVFGCSPLDDLAAFPEALQGGAPSQVAENGAGLVPVMSLGSLKKYDPECSLLEFALTARDGFLPSAQQGCYEPVYLTASGEALGLACGGQLRILLTGRRPHGYFSLDLCAYSGGIFRLRAEEGQKRGAVFPLPLCSGEAEFGKPLWRMPVAEVTFLPVKAER